jgi:putative addiction module component (TIGR02574 family)
MRGGVGRGDRGAFSYPDLVEAIWDGIVSRGAAPSLTEAQQAELDRRLADHLTNPNDVIPWSEVKAAALAKIRQ